jgi:hypothetical protein
MLLRFVLFRAASQEDVANFVVLLHAQIVASKDKDGKDQFNAQLLSIKRCVAFFSFCKACQCSEPCCRLSLRRL